MDISFTRKEFLSYTLMPQLMPRARRIAGKGFSHLAFFMALVYRAVNLLPSTHPFADARNIGKFGLRQVIAAAANNVQLSRNHLDQVVIFFAILAALVILFIQFILLFVFISVGSAMAQSEAPEGFGDLFDNKNAKTDLALRLLSHIFGVHELFGVSEQGNAAFHLALQGLFQFYSVALLIVAVLIVLYFVFAVVAETAQHGTPFGRRFNHVWAPIRLVVAAGLLIPVGTGGLNAAQYITLYAAKFGSNFATNGWMTFNDVLGESWKSTGANDTSELVATPNTPDIQHIGAFMTIVKACEIANEQKYKNNGKIRGIGPYLVRNSAVGGGEGMGSKKSFKAASEYFEKGDIRIRFGEYNVQYTQEKGNVKPWCGEIVLANNNEYEPGVIVMQEAYYQLIWKLWTDESGLITPVAENYARRFLGIESFSSTSDDPRVDAKFKKDMYTYLKDYLDKAIKKAVEEQEKTETWKKDEDQLKAYGWAGAGVWYNKVAQVNGVLVAAVDALPSPRMMPWVMEEVREIKKQNSSKIDPESMYRADLSDGMYMYTEAKENPQVSDVLNNLYSDWIKDGGIRADSLSSHTKLTQNPVVDFINMIFGTSGLFDMCKNADIHPLAQLSNVGKGLVEHSIKMFAASIGVSGLSFMMYSQVGAGLSAVSSLLVTIGMIGLVAGFILFYIIPFLPFLYFFLAVGEWVKSLFEAMVGVPLWALAHLRIDGDGLPGSAALDGYYLIFESFLRPIMIIFGLLASLSIFAAMVKVLNEIFYLAVSNLSGNNPERTAGCGKGGGGEVGTMEWFRGPIDEFFFTIIYAILVYMIGMSCFKLIDLIPDNILRWIGTGVQSFGKSVGDQAEGFTEKLSVAGTDTANQATGAFSKLGTAGQKAAQGLMDLGGGKK
jgi:conjugal transfer/type IV secretion protein DotA/TraY